MKRMGFIKALAIGAISVAMPMHGILTKHITNTAARRMDVQKWCKRMKCSEGQLGWALGAMPFHGGRIQKAEAYAMRHPIQFAAEVRKAKLAYPIDEWNV